MKVAMSLEPVIALLRGLLLVYLLLDATTTHAQSNEELKKSVVKITAIEGQKKKVGSGFIVKADSDAVYIVTAAHVVAGDSQPNVQFFTQQDVKIQVTVKHAEGSDDPTALALLVLRGKGNIPAGLTTMSLATATRVTSGDDIMVIGHPRGAGDWAIIKGSIASREGRDLKVDANIDEGNSGGPIIHNGQVVGLIGGAQRYGKGVTIGTIREYLEGHGVVPEERSLSSVAKAPPPSSQSTQPIAKPESQPVPHAREITGKDGAPMVMVPAGEFVMGWREDGKTAMRDARPAHPVFLDAYYIEQYEVTTSRYANFLHNTRRPAPDDWSEQVAQKHGNKPVVGVDWNDASAYCAWAGRRLPTEAEWEKAARGTDQREYPWGNEEPTQQRANFDHCCEFKDYGALTDVGSFEKDKSPYGVYDMAGNVSEWTADWFDYAYYRKSPSRNPKGPSSGQERMVRGGSWGNGPVLVRSAYRSRYTPPAKRLDNIGFRCAQDAPN